MRANSVTDVNDTRAKARDKSAARLAILDAARRLAAQNGIEELTLSAVATEAGIARATVYGYFKSKDELMQSVVADDLSGLAHMISGVDWPEPAEEFTADAETEIEVETAEGEAEAEVTAPEYSAQIFAMPPPAANEQAHLEEAAVEEHQAEAPADDAPVVEPLLHEDAAAQYGSLFDIPKEDDGAERPVSEEAQYEERVALDLAPPAERSIFDVEQNTEAVPQEDTEQPAEPFAAVEAVGETADEGQSLRQERRAALESILNKLAPNDPENSEGSAASIARLDRRLRVIERTVADVHSNQERTEKNKTTSADSTAETMRGLSQRMEEAERRQREALAELRASSREAMRRLDALERGTVAPAVEPAAPEVPSEPFVPDVAVSLEMPTAPVEPGEPKGPAYLAAARLSARAAATEPAEPKKRSWLYRFPRRYLTYMCAMLSVVVMVIGVLVVQRASAIAGQTGTIMPNFAKRTVTHAPAKRLAVVSPLDELSAMANSGNGKAQLIVGLKYLRGEDGVAKNSVEAAKWIARAAQRGEPMGQYWAGYIYQHGVGVSVDADEALRWYEAAADQGNTKAMYNLGVGYAEGWAGAKDAPEASRWFARAARMGFVDAQFNLAVLYERGLGVPASLSDAYKWYAIAAKNGDPESKKRVDALATQMGADDLAAAQRSVMIFQATPAVPGANTLPVLDLKRT